MIFFDPTTWFHPEAVALFVLRGNTWRDKQIARLFGNINQVREAAIEHQLLNAYGLILAIQNGWIKSKDVALPKRLFRNWQS